MSINLTPRYLVFVSNADNHNKYYKQIPNGDGTWTAEYGRVGSKPQKRVYSSSQYESKYREKLAKGYVDQTHLMTDLIEKVETKKSNEYKEIEDKSIAEIVQRLQDLAKKAISDNYTVKAEAVTQAMVDNAQEILLKLTSIKTVPAFNKRLIDLFAVIPRKMSKVENYLATKTDDFPKIIQREQDLLDIMKGQIYKPEIKKEEKQDKPLNDCTILEANGLIFEKCSPADIRKIKLALGESEHKFKNAWKVTNIETQRKFDEFVKTNDIKKKKLLFHGSRNENWWSIINTGLKLKPTNVIITGKLYGMGTYFAPKAKKSIGYTSLSGSYWAGGNSSFGFMALMDVAYGTPYDVYDFDSRYHRMDYNLLQTFKPGANCLHAHAGASMGYSSLRNDEIVVYKEEQCTIKYLVEIQN